MADKQRRAQFLAAYDEKNRLVQRRRKTRSSWSVTTNGRFQFRGQESRRVGVRYRKGREEVLNRRIGQNELDAIQVSLGLRRCPARIRHEGSGPRTGLLEYAQKFRSDPGKKNGLYWEAKAGEEQSPLGPFAARARSEGYGQNKASDKPVPYRGYYYRILTAQGKNAPGGAYSYLVKGNMIGGFALVAYPAEYGNSGVMTFIVNHDGKVFQKDLGKNTAATAAAMKEYNPD